GTITPHAGPIASHLYAAAGLVRVHPDRTARCDHATRIWTSFKGLHAHRAAGGDRDHRDPDRAPLPHAQQGAAKGGGPRLPHRLSLLPRQRAAPDRPAGELRPGGDARVWTVSLAPPGQPDLVPFGS